MWSIRRVKEVGKARFKSNYWKCVFVASVLVGLVGGIGSITLSFPSDSSESIESIKSTFAMLAEDAYTMGFVVGVFLLGMFLGMMVGMAIGFVLDAFIFNPIYVGISRFTYRNLSENAKVREFAFAFDNSYKNIVHVMFIRELKQFAWGLLFIIPGIIKGYEYRMIPFLLTENPNMGMDEAFAESRRMMKGNKGKAFLMDLSFLGWDILGVLTLGILTVFYVEPYKAMANAALYDAIKYEKVILPQNSGRNA